MKATGIKDNTLRRGLRTMDKLGLVVQEPKAPARRYKKSISITKLGRDTLDFIKNYENILAKPALDESTHDRLKELLARLEDPVLIDALKEEHFNELSQLGHSKPEILIYQEVQDYIESYIEKQRVDRYIDNFLNLLIIKNVVQNSELQEWFYAKLFNKIKEQFQNKQLDETTRKARLTSLWQVLFWDEDTRDGIIKSVVNVFEAECVGSESEWCKSIRMTYPIPLKHEIIEGFHKYARTETINRFFESSLGGL